MLPALEAAGRATFRWPDRKQGRSLPEILDDCPEVAVVIDTFEQRLRRPKDREKAREYYSGKKKQITHKTQVCVDWDRHICHVSESVPGPTADITLLKETKVLERLPEGAGAWGDSAYQDCGTFTLRDWPLTHDGNPEANLAPRRIRLTTPPFRGSGSLWNTELVIFVISRHCSRCIGTIWTLIRQPL